MHDDTHMPNGFITFYMLGPKEDMQCNRKS